MRKYKLFIFFLLMFNILYAGADNISDAVKNAADKTIDLMTVSPNTSNIKDIAFVGFANNKLNYSDEFRASLSGNSEKFHFYTRNEVELGDLAREIEFGEKRSDIMKSETIQKFGRLNGIQALLSGKIINAEEDSDGYAVFKISLNLLEIETGRVLWGDIITGNYRPSEAFEPIFPEISKAAIDAGKNLGYQLMLSKDNFPDCNIFIMPFIGENAQAISNIIVSELDEYSSDRISLFSNNRIVDKRWLDDIKIDVKGNEPVLSAIKLVQLKEKLIKNYNLNPKAFNGGKYGDSKLNCYMLGTVNNVFFDKKDNAWKIIINIQIRNLENNKQVWSRTVEGEYELNMTLDEWLRQLWKNNKFAFIGGGVIVIALILILLFIIVSRYMGRVR